MTNKGFLQRLVSSLNLTVVEDLEFVFRAGQDNMHDNEYVGTFSGPHPDDVTPDWEQWLELPVDPQVLEDHRSRIQSFK